MTDKIWDSAFQQTPGSRKAHRTPTGPAFFRSTIRMHLNKKIPVITMINMINSHYANLSAEETSDDAIEDIHWLNSIFNDYDYGVTTIHQLHRDLQRYVSEVFQ